MICFDRIYIILWGGATVSGSSGSVATASTTYPANQMNTIAPGGPIIMSRNGYFYVWVSNETQGWDVFFDNLAAQYKQGPILEENHYYPFGLTMTGISDKAARSNYSENKYRYNGKELQHQEFADGSGLETYDYGLRMYDPQLGRWNMPDPLAGEYKNCSPYAYVMDQPINAIDPDGRYIFGLFGSTSEQRKAARKLAKETGGEVENITSKGNIHVQYTNSELSDNGDVVATGRRAYFSDEGAPISKSERSFISTKEGAKEWASMVSKAWMPGYNEWTQINAITGEIRHLDGPIEYPLIDPVDIAAGMLGGGVQGVAAAGGETAGEEGVYTYTKSAAEHLDEVVKKGPNAGQLARPYMKSPLVIKEIVATGTGVADKYAAGAIKYAVKGFYRGSAGTWELVINPTTNLIYHFNFVK